MVVQTSEDKVIRCTRLAHLKAVCSEAFSQWSWRRSGVMWSNLKEEKMSQAAAFVTDWSRDKR